MLHARYMRHLTPAEPRVATRVWLYTVSIVLTCVISPDDHMTLVGLLHWFSIIASLMQYV